MVIVALPVTFVVIFCGTFFITWLAYVVTHPHSTRLPLLCNAGASKPAYYAYSYGLATAAALLSLIMLFQQQRFDSQLDSSGYRAFNWVTFFIGIVCAFCLANMGVWPLWEAETAHNVFASIFQTTGSIYEFLFATLSILAKQSKQQIWWRFACSFFALSLVILMAPVMYLEHRRQKVRNAPSSPAPQPRRSAPTSDSKYLADSQELKPPGEVNNRADDDVEAPQNNTNDGDTLPKAAEPKPVLPKRRKRPISSYIFIFAERYGMRTWAVLQYLSLASVAVYFITFIEDFRSADLHFKNLESNLSPSSEPVAFGPVR